MLFIVPIDRFETDLLRFNTLLAVSMAEDGEDVPDDGIWETSLETFGSVRYDGRVLVDVDDLVDAATLQPIAGSSKVSG